MKDVAARCGISESTVSHVVNETRPVAPRTRERVLRAMRELRYHGNAHARRLARGHSDVVGLVISDVENPFYPGLIRAFEEAAIAAGLDVLLCTTNYQPDRAERALRRLIQNRATGVAVMTSSIEAGLGSLLAEAGIPAAFLDGPRPGPRRSRIAIGYDAGVRAAINHLRKLGHRSLALVAGPQHRASHARFRAAAEAAARAQRLALRVIEGQNDLASGERAGTRLITADVPPTAILCSNDLTALGVTRALRRAGVAVPAEVSVVGADDVPLAALVDPPLTTIRIPREPLGRLAFELLRQMSTSATPRGTERTLETEFVIRGSSGPAPH